MRILLLGGTAFLSHATATEAVRRGHEVTCLARGSAPAPEGVRFVRGDRDEPDGLAPVRGQRWDAVVDVSRQPGQVRRAVAELDTPHWVFVSTANVYALPEEGSAGTPPTETDPLLEPLEADVMSTMEEYGPAKVACEQAVTAQMTRQGGTATLVRAGLIGGPGDESGRVGYWPWRFAHPSGPDVLVPDDPDFPVAFVDVRDLASWLVHAAEQRLDGALNATGPVVPLAELLEAARAVAGAQVPARPAPPARLAELGVHPWMGPRSLPLWIDDPALRSFAALDTTRARAAGLRTRPVDQTLRDTLAWEETRQTPRAAGLTDEEEQEIREALDARA
ncbi:oxidoreductase [Serinicoccus chungangensis]|uniref:Oxidoreductase n=1 Tax=Serinicoccus chungangensis TaxID=767452 RepID=A0A0W8IBV1_9MICO|nr:NAD-dependent epimerase/dehydratase family protein [Serinicoccus chungangensis]KUG57417.1 oxidoreductase [Serinicoccus chungangensis]